MKTKVKCLFYAYPSSIVANALGHKSTGCHYLFIGDEDKPISKPLEGIVFSSPNAKEVLDKAAEYPEPWGNYSMHKTAEKS